MHAMEAKGFASGVSVWRGTDHSICVNSLTEHEASRAYNAYGYPGQTDLDAPKEEAMSRTLSLSAAGVLLSVCIGGNACAAEPRYFNTYMIRAYEKLKSDPNRANQGYDKNGYFTKDLNYGDEPAAIYASKRMKPKTMCNAAVTETLLEAINLYAADTKGRWSPEKIIPANSWNSTQWSQLKAHLFAYNYLESKPLSNIKDQTDIWPGIRKDINNFHSEHGMSIALEKFGLGDDGVKFEDARPGDLISFDRDRITTTGKKKGSGHSVVFLSFLTRDQKEVSKYVPNQVVGFKYFSAQSSEPAGLNERWAYFKGEMCPFAEGEKPPTKSTSSYCPDAISSSANRSKFPRLKAGTRRDCCVIRRGPDGPRVGRVFTPVYWHFEAKRKEVQQDEEELKAAVGEYMRARARSGEVLKLLASATLAVEKKNPQLAAAYTKEVQNKFGEDLRTIAQQSAAPDTGTRKIHAILQITPKSITKRANEQVNRAARDDLPRRVQARAVEQLRLLNSEAGSPSSRFDEDTD